MNEFTEEELIWLEEELKIGIDEYQQPEIGYKIHDKIRKMIEEYHSVDKIRRQTNLHGGCV
jgi:hypothetical protein